jgi:peptidoglycan pentaglycine glycine transferase (the first glycine)
MTRNAIRDATRAGVAVTVDTDLRDLPVLLELCAQTAADQHFAPVASRYIEAEARIFARHGQAAICCARRDDVALAAVLVLFEGDAAYAHFDASARTAPRSSAPHLVQWRIMEAAPARGCTQYDLWGTALVGASCRDAAPAPAWVTVVVMVDVRCAG